MESKIAKYDFEPPTRMSGFYLYYNSSGRKANLNEAEVKIICNALRVRLGDLAEKFEAL